MTVIKKPVVWSWAGLDNSGMAGQLADVRTMHALGVHACCVTTAVTAQNSQGVIAINPTSKEQLETQLKALQELGLPDAIKVGVLPSSEALELLIAFMGQAKRAINLVLDPVISSSSGTKFMPESVFRRLEKLLPYVTVFTPNIMELEILTDTKIESIQDIENQAKKLLDLGMSAVLVKGGHWQAGKASDFFVSKEHQFWLHSKRHSTGNTRGTGCVFSSAIASALALEYSIKDAVVIGKMVINQGLRNSYAVSNQQGPLVVRAWPVDEEDMPHLTNDYAVSEYSFPSLNQQTLGLYPVVDRAEWLGRLLPLGIETIQLRMKDLQGDDLENEIIAAVKIAKQYDAKLFINDYWQLAIKHGAFGVHLGQEDLDDADLAEISQAELHLGLSTHCFYEVARAHAVQPSYLACGPVFHTESKQMPWVPQGIKNLEYWNAMMQSYPWVAIGGIDQQKLATVAATGVSGIAMISAITQSQEPEKAAKKMMQQVQQYRPTR